MLRPAAADGRRVAMPYADPLLLWPLPGARPGLTAFVRFEPGWRRSRPVRCSASELFVVLTGRLEVNGEDCTGSLVHVPAGGLRVTTSTEAGCLALAWFDAAPRWEPAGEPAGEPDPGALHPVLLDDLDARAPLRLGDSLWSLDDGLRGCRQASACELVDLDDPAWLRVEPGGTDPVSPHRHLRRRW